jgi:hypothetical protein
MDEEGEWTTVLGNVSHGDSQKLRPGFEIQASRSTFRSLLFLSAKNVICSMVAILPGGNFPCVECGDQMNRSDSENSSCRTICSFTCCRSIRPTAQFQCYGSFLRHASRSLSDISLTKPEAAEGILTEINNLVCPSATVEKRKDVMSPLPDRALP